MADGVRRCINIDWLEVHALEPVDSPRTPEFFQKIGWEVAVRPYGTRFYTQMFTLIFPDGQRFLEIRRAPSAANSKSAAQYFEPNSVSIRLVNRVCYFKQCAKLLDDFIKQYGFEFRRISRIDIALDFEKFDSGDDPQKFLHRFMKGRYSKINQCNIRAYGKDKWDGRFWNSISWGSPKSQIGTKFYCKSQEIREAKDKPYIRQAWASAGLVDDFIQLTKKDEKGVYYTPSIWRVEFSIQSSVRGWYTYEIDELGNKQKHSYRNLLDRFYTDQQLIDIFASLCSHYFHFKVVEEKKRPSLALQTIRKDIEWNNREKDLQRKDRCKDKELFKFNEQAEFYTIEKVATEKPQDLSIVRLLIKLQAYRETHFDKDLRKAIDILIHALNEERLRKSAVRPYDQDEVGLLRELIALRIHNHGANPYEVDLETAKRLWEIEKKLWDNDEDRIPT